MFIIYHGEFNDGDVCYFSYSASKESFRVFAAVVDDLEERSSCGYEEPWVAWDTFTYLCGKWKGSRPPKSLPLSLWFTPRKELGTWVALENNRGDGFRMTKGSWASIVEMTFYGEPDDEDDHESRSISKGDWDNQVEMAESERLLEEERKAKKAKMDV